MVGRRLRHIVIRMLVACFVVGGRLSEAQGPPPASVPEADRVRIVEAFRVADAIGDRLWAGWSAAPFAVLLVTPEREFLVRHPAPTPDFVPAGSDPALGGPIWSRPRQFDVRLLASFPAVAGVPTIVIGQPAHTTVKRSTAWTLTLLHEHFHQWQSSQPGYYDGVNGLGLTGGDGSGTWMLNYPFPYDTPDVQQQFAAMSARLDEALSQPPGEATERAARAYLDAKLRLRSLISAGDYRYLNFQLWQEGVARYAELHVAELAASGGAPSAAFAALADHTTYASEASALRLRIRNQLAGVRLGEAKRSAFYAVGAGEGLLLDRIRPGWRARYATAGFGLDELLAGADRP